MAARLQGWFARQSVTVKLLVTVPVLLAALFWSTLPGNSARNPDPSNQPVLSGANSRGTLDTAAANGTPGGTPSGTPAATTQAAPALLPHQEPQPADTGMSWSTVLRTLVSVAVVIVLILLSAQGLKYVMAGAAQPLRSNHTIHVVETLHLPSPSGRGRTAIHLVEVGEQLLLIGATDAQLTLLTELPDDEAARLRARAATPSASGTPAARPGDSFADLLAAADSTHQPGGELGRGEAKPGAGNGHSSTFGEADLTRLLERLRESKQRLEADN